MLNKTVKILEGDFAGLVGLVVGVDDARGGYLVDVQGSVNDQPFKEQLSIAADNLELV